MLNDLSKKFQQIISGMDQETLEKGLKAVSEIMNTEEGQKFADQFINVDKEKLAEQLTGIDENQISEKLSNMNLDQLTDRISHMDKDQLAKELTNSPDLVKKINDLIDK